MRLIIEDGQLMLVGDGGIELTRVALEDHADLQAAADVLTDWAAAYRTPEQEYVDQLLDALVEADVEGAANFIDPWSGEGVKYTEGKYVTYEGTIFRIKTTHVSQEHYPPTVAITLYEIPYIPDSSPQPWVSGQLYAKGVSVTHNGGIWLSEVPDNVWEPGGPGVYDNIWKRTGDAV